MSAPAAARVADAGDQSRWSADAATAPPSAAIAEEVRSAFDYMPAILAGNLAGIAVLSLLFGRSAPAPTLLAWLLPTAVVWLLRCWMLRSFQRARVESAADWQHWRLLWNLGILASGALWGLSAWLLHPLGDSNQRTALIIVVYTFCVAAVPVLASQPRIYLLFAALCFVPMVSTVLRVAEDDGLQLAGILVVIFSMTTLLARNYRQALQRAIELKLQADRLLLQLRSEKQLAEQARREAEVANRAKTQFFSAASHDLRQPLHAMGLFAEALRSKSLDDEVAQLVNSINESVDALESLFSELLDITRIDSGGVAVHPQAFEFGDILRKLRLHFEPLAFEKGLALRMRGGRHGIWSDPLLVERIVRNLVSNAIRYSADGTVLVGARRRGDRVLLQVWDTGQGIAEAQQQRIFEEFYQIAASGPSLQDGQRKGLGLGLAIVKRLADLIGAPVELRSQPGRGSVFSLTLPAGRAVREPAARPAHQPLSKVTLEGRNIVIVEDEPAVRAGVEVLLRQWGATTFSFDSFAAVAGWAAGDAEAVPVDLLIVDYRLEDGRTGVDALRLLRQRLGARVPAIVVTGSTMSGHEDEAQHENFHLLIKPVVPNKLRAMIAFKLGARLR